MEQASTTRSASASGRLATQIADSGAGTFAATYDADGNLVDQGLPNGLHQCTTYDDAGQATERIYQSGGACGDSGTTTILDYTVGISAHGQWLLSSGPSGSGGAAAEQYAYDAAGRITQAQDVLDNSCTTRQYGYDADTNRTGYVSTGPGVSGVCQSGSLATIHNYDTADRLVDSGVTYDAMGRTGVLPAATTGTAQQAFTYYESDRVETLTQNGITTTETLDPMLRAYATSTSASSSSTMTSHYSSDGDFPTWITENTAGTAWTRLVGGVDGMLSAQESETGSVAFLLTNLHGDVAATANAAGTLAGTQDYDEFGRPRVAGDRYGWLGGYLRRADATSDAVLMGLRVYEPALGRFLQADPVYGGSANSYDYVDGDPLNSLDLNGTLTACTLTVYRPFYNSGRIHGSGLITCEAGQYEIFLDTKVCIQRTETRTIYWHTLCPADWSIDHPTLLISGFRPLPISFSQSCVSGTWYYRTQIRYKWAWYAKTNYTDIRTSPAPYGN